MARKQAFTAKQICEACKGTGGIMALVARKLECSRVTIWRYAKRYKTVREALHQADEELTDIAEAKAFQLIKAEYWPAIHYRLKTKGKDRGYTERTEITGAEGGPLKHEDVGLTDEKRIARLAAIFDAARGRRDGPVDE